VPKQSPRRSGQSPRPGSRSGPPLTPALPLERFVEVLESLGVRVEMDTAQAPPHEELVMTLAHSLVGVVEMHARLAESAARAAGAGMPEIGEATEHALAGANCTSELEGLMLLEWRAIRTTLALQQIKNHPEHRGPDSLLETILLTSAALGGLLSASVVMKNMRRDAGATAVAAQCLRSAIAALDKAAEHAHTQRVAADLLDLTD
jgi:hypothetical protein